MGVEPGIVYYAFGGGMGHVTRASAILRRLRPLVSTPTTVLTNTQFSIPLQHERIPYLHFSDTTSDTLRRSLTCALDDYPPSIMVMDVFPTGVLDELSGILPSLPCRKVLVYRHVREPYASGLSEISGLFDCILAAETPYISFQCPMVDCTPIVRRNPEEMLSRTEARRILRASGDKPVVLGVSTGEIGWTTDFFVLLRKALRRLKAKVTLRLAAPYDFESSRFVSHYPLFELFNGVDILVGASGYNLFHEAQLAGVPSIFVPQPRRYDDQYFRARSAVTANSPEELESALKLTLDCVGKPRPSAYFANGAVTAARALVELLKHAG